MDSKHYFGVITKNRVLTFLDLFRSQHFGSQNFQSKVFDETRKTHIIVSLVLSLFLYCRLYLPFRFAEASYYLRVQF